MDNVIVILGGYKPNLSATGVCADRIIRCLRREGYDVDCIGYRPCGTLKHEDIDGVHIHRVEPLLNYRFRDKAAKRDSPFLKKWYGVLVKILDVASVFTNALTFPRESALRSRRMERQARKIAEAKGSRLVIGINYPCDSLYAAYRLKRSKPDIKFIAYCLDPLSDGKHSKLLGERRSLVRARDLERKILRTADAVVVQFEHEAHFEKLYPQEERSNVFYLGVPLLQERIVPELPASGERTVLFAGTLSKKTRDPSFMFQVFRYTKHTRLVMYVLSDEDVYRKMAEGIDHVIIHGKVPYDVIQREYLKADAFLNIGNTQALFAPSKIIEYISYGKPILSTYRVDGDTCGEYMKSYPNGLYIDERVEDPAEVASRIDEWLFEARPTIPYRQLRRLYHGNTPEAFLEVVATVLSEEIQ